MPSKSSIRRRGPALEPSAWRVGRKSLAGTGFLAILASPGIALLVPPVGIFLALLALFVGIGLIFRSAVWISDPCPFCHAVQTVWVPMEGLSRRQVRRQSSGRVFGADCIVCRNRMIVRMHDRMAIPAPRVTVLSGTCRALLVRLQNPRQDRSRAMRDNRASPTRSGSRRAATSAPAHA